MMETSTDRLSNTTDAPVKVFVKAPSTLPAGYTFEACAQGFEDYNFTVTVPEGGVTVGQEILVELPFDFKGERIEAPTGRWKDGIFSCFNYGIFHSSVWCACCCTQRESFIIIFRQILFLFIKVFTHICLHCENIF